MPRKRKLPDAAEPKPKKLRDPWREFPFDAWNIVATFLRRQEFKTMLYVLTKELHEAKWHFEPLKDVRDIMVHEFRTMYLLQRRRECYDFRYVQFLGIDHNAGKKILPGVFSCVLNSDIASLIVRRMPEFRKIGEEFGNALKTNQKLKELALISDRGMGGRHLIKIDLATARAFGKALAKNTTLRHLEITNGIMNAECRKALFTGLEKNRGLQKLILKNCLDDQYWACLHLERVLALNTDLHTLNLSDNDISGGISPLTVGIRQNNTLKTLQLNRNCIDNDGMIELAHSLRINQSITHIEVAQNLFSTRCLYAWETTGIIRHRDGFPIIHLNLGCIHRATVDTEFLIKFKKDSKIQTIWI